MHWVDYGKYFTQLYNYVLSERYISFCLENKLMSDGVAGEYRNLIKAVENARNDALKLKRHDVSTLTGVPNDFSFMNDRSVINCAEIWGARTMILKGYKFNELIINTHVWKYKDRNPGELFPPCENCQHTFSSISSNIEGYKV